MPCHTLTESAKLAGVSRRTIQRYVKSGKLSSRSDHRGNPTIETSELLRVFGELSHSVTPENNKMSHIVTPTAEAIREAVEEAQKPLLAQIEQLREEIYSLNNRLEYKSERAREIKKETHKTSDIMSRLKAKIIS